MAEGGVVKRRQAHVWLVPGKFEDSADSTIFRCYPSDLRFFLPAASQILSRSARGEPLIYSTSYFASDIFTVNRD